MQRATPVQMRKSLEIVEAFKKAGLWFVPMPVFDEDDFNSHAAKITEKLEEMERRANLAESIKQIAPSKEILQNLPICLVAVSHRWHPQHL